MTAAYGKRQGARLAGKKGAFPPARVTGMAWKATRVTITRGGVRCVAAGTAELQQASWLQGTGSRVGPRRGRLCVCACGGKTNSISPSSHHEAAEIGGNIDDTTTNDGVVVPTRQRRYVAPGGFSLS